MSLSRGRKQRWQLRVGSRRRETVQHRGKNQNLNQRANSHEVRHPQFVLARPSRSGRGVRGADDVPRHAALYLTDGFRWLDAARSGLRNHPDLVTLVTPMLLGHEVVLTAIEPMGRSMEEALVVRREQHIPAPPAAVFALLTDPEKILRWMGTEAQVQPQPGGLYLVNVTGARFARGEFREVVPVHRLAFSFGWEGC